ncbi:MAG: HEAT repeat domain-containing protein [Deltaproteobacteria bacterium]|nr:MAG: HEAT repeat domain-containing protein [Deltaproteobacteria bacterium]TMA73295.1 MAG: HEAT repeat domain-containing protein [Deltaproteobacteria bacterium]TMB37770.1 MAG: HEAT repeat domain-containing protein [Deltaproteobacteria bacterium]
MGESAADPRRLRVRAGLAFVQVLRPALYALLALSALFTFWSGGPVAGRTLPYWTRSVAPTIFGIFLAIFTFYRFALMRAKKYPAATGLFQVGLGALIWVLLLPSTRQKIRPPSAPVDEVPALMASPDPRVRALAVEVAGYRRDGARYAAEMIDRLDDADPAVRERAHAALVRLAGHDEGRDPDAWREEGRKRGWLR